MFANNLPFFWAQWSSAAEISLTLQCVICSDSSSVINVSNRFVPFMRDYHEEKGIKLTLYSPLLSSYKWSVILSPSDFKAWHALLESICSRRSNGVWGVSHGSRGSKHCKSSWNPSVVSVVSLARLSLPIAHSPTFPSCTLCAGPQMFTIFIALKCYSPVLINTVAISCGKASRWFWSMTLCLYDLFTWNRWSRHRKALLKSLGCMSGMESNRRACWTNRSFVLGISTKSTMWHSLLLSARWGFRLYHYN